VLTQVYLPDGTGPVDLVLRQGRIERIGNGLVPDAQIINCAGGTVLPGFVDAHMHLDKTLIGEQWIPLPNLGGASVPMRVAEAEAILENLTTLSVAERAELLAQQALALGTMALRSHVDVTPAMGLRSVEALLGVRERLASQVDIQLVAFPQAGFNQPGVPDLLEEAMRLGCSVIGGIDPATVDGDIEQQLRALFQLAVRFDAAIDVHLHDLGWLGAFELDRICAWTDAEGFAGRVVVSHAFTLGDLSENDSQTLVERVARTGVAIVTCATGHRPLPRARQLWKAGVLLGVGSDNVHDTWSPYGRGDALEMAFLFAYRNGLRTDPELYRALETVTTTNARILGRPVGDLAVGAPADLVVVDPPNGAAALAAHGPRRAVIRRGQVIHADGWTGGQLTP
jgi:cytosine/creatinine deaminase